MVAAAVIGSAVIGAAGSAYAGSQSAKGQENAANTQRGMFNTINGQEQPFMQAGYGATGKLNELLGTGGDSTAADYGSLDKPFTSQDYLNNQDPGYQFQLQTGEQALRNADTPGVGSLSGSALKDLMTFNQGMASTGYQNAFNRYQTQNNNTFARLSGIAGLGQNAASNTGTAGTSLGTGIAQAQGGAANALASGTLGVTGSLAGGSNTLAGLMYLNNGNTNNPNNLGGSTPMASAGNALTYDSSGNITGSAPSS